MPKIPHCGLPNKNVHRALQDQHKAAAGAGLGGGAGDDKVAGDGAPVALAELGQAQQEHAVLLLRPGDALAPLLVRCWLGGRSGHLHLAGSAMESKFVSELGYRSVGGPLIAERVGSSGSTWSVGSDRRWGCGVSGTAQAPAVRCPAGKGMGYKVCTEAGTASESSQS